METGLRTRTIRETPDSHCRVLSIVVQINFVELSEYSDKILTIPENINNLYGIFPYICIDTKTQTDQRYENQKREI